MRIVIIGGSGHIGTYLIPRLVSAGHEVINISRGKSSPYHSSQVWNGVQQVVLNRSEEEKSGQFGKKVLELYPDVVIDLICFSLESAKQIVESLEGKIKHFISCGTIWVHGHSKEVPVTEDQSRSPFGDYGIQKAEIESYLLEKARQDGFPATVLHPGHIVGPGWVPLNPAGHFNPQVFVKLANREEVCLPNFGLETVHHVHADDVAQAFAKTVENWNASIGENFHVVSPAALTLRGYAEEAASWFGQSANLNYLPWNEWRLTVEENEANATWDHIAHSPNCSIEKAKRLLNYQPRYSSLEAVRESVMWLINQGVVKTN
ncbi:NAD-dependent epimerase/dehydratase family protein [Bacillus sp. UNC41MFS5]|uniref:NAD-dependent epimerase/dehydratase family protein n=1 Tax=Bacillus sp. UNC41MFS5 TaxID=1449046 RepID=UPI00047C6081|nr:NAD(P)-dependent oxidoreductase [Bacillus sp. UNC41MFS5]